MCVKFEQVVCSTASTGLLKVMRLRAHKSAHTHALAYLHPTNGLLLCHLLVPEKARTLIQQDHTRVKERASLNSSSYYPAILVQPTVNGPFPSTSNNLIVSSAPCSLNPRRRNRELDPVTWTHHSSTKEVTLHTWPVTQAPT